MYKRTLTKKTLLICFTLLFLNPSFSQESNSFRAFNHSQARVLSNFNSIDLSSLRADSSDLQNPYIIVDIQLDKHWHTYAQNPGDSGASVKVNIASNIDDQLELSKGLWPVPKRHITEGMHTFIYDNRVMGFYPFKLKDIADFKQKQLQFNIDLEWLVCKEECVPNFAEFQLNIPVNNTSSKHIDIQTIEEHFSKIPQPALNDIYIHKQNDKNIQILLHNKHLLESFDSKESIDVYIEEPLDLSSDFDAKKFDDRVLLTYQKFSPDTITKLKGSLTIATLNNTKEYYSLNYPGKSDLNSDRIKPRSAPNTQALSAAHQSQPSKYKLQQANKPSILGLFTAPANKVQTKQWFMLILAFLGGLILNIMPCVFPILSLKISSLALLSKEESKHIRKDALFFSLGCMACFTLLAAIIIIAKQSGSHFLGWGFQLQSPYFVFVLFLLFSLIAFSFIDLIQFKTPQALESMQSKAVTKSAAGKQPYVQSFLLGALAVLVATPCSAPFMGTALGFALTQHSFYTLIIFIFLALGFAFPYLLIAAIPKLLPKLPKGGAWLEHFRHILFFPMLASVFWMAWLLGKLSSINTMFFSLLLLSCLALLLYTYKNRKNFHKAFSILILLISATATTYLSYWLVTALQSKVKAKESQNKEATFFKPFDAKHIAQLRQNNQNVFVIFTADWCITCKINESTTLKQASTIELFKKHKVQAFIADWTNYDEKISKYLSQYQRSSVPFYVLYQGQQNPHFFSELLSKKNFQAQIENIFTTKD